jgi:hypothetical protein
VAGSASVIRAGHSCVLAAERTKWGKLITDLGIKAG